MASAVAEISVWQVAEYGIVLQQMRQRLRVREVVDGDDFDVFVAQRGTQYVAPDTAKAVDTHLDCHVSSEIKDICLCESVPDSPRSRQTNEGRGLT